MDFYLTLEKWIFGLWRKTIHENVKRDYIHNLCLFIWIMGLMSTTCWIVLNNFRAGKFGQCCFFPFNIVICKILQKNWSYLKLRLLDHIFIRQQKSVDVGLDVLSWISTSWHVRAHTVSLFTSSFLWPSSRPTRGVMCHSISRRVPVTVVKLISPPFCGIEKWTRGTFSFFHFLFLPFMRISGLF